MLVQNPYTRAPELYSSVDVVFRNLTRNRAKTLSDVFPWSKDLSFFGNSKMKTQHNAASLLFSLLHCLFTRDVILCPKINHNISSSCFFLRAMQIFPAFLSRTVESTTSDNSCSKYVYRARVSLWWWWWW